MPSRPALFAPPSPRALVELVTVYPLAWVVSGAPETRLSTLVPLRARLNDSGDLVGFTGHFARANEQVAALRRDNRATALFTGPNGYISPAWLHDRSQAPTWNYASASFSLAVDFFEQPEAIAAHLREMVDTFEGDRPNRWRPEEMGDRFARLAQRVIGFTARIVRVDAVFKLGQDERDDVYADILKGLDDTGQQVLVDWMRRGGKGRGSPAQ